MREIALFGEDDAHRQVIGSLVQRIADDHHQPVTLNWLNAEGGHGRVIATFRAYLRDLTRQNRPMPDLIIVATDANCHGLNRRIREITGITDTVASPIPPVVTAIPDPHIERWLLLDGAAFRQALGRGCQAPEHKCDRDLYKQRLRDAVWGAGILAFQGGIEYAHDIVQGINIERVKQADRSLQLFLDGLAGHFRQWGS